MERSRRIDWNIGGGRRGREEVSVHFSPRLNRDQNLREIIEFLRDRHEVESEEIDVAVEKVFGEDDPDTCSQVPRRNANGRERPLSPNQW